MTFIKEQLKRQYHAGDVIFKDGVPGQSMYILLEGQVEISKILGDHKTILANITPGSIFGEMAILDRHNRSATAKAVTDSVALEISRELFHHRLEEVPKWMQSFFTILASRLRDATRNQSILLTQGPGRQVVNLLAMLAKQEEPDTMDQIIVPWTKAVATIAFLLAFNQERVNDILNALVSSKVAKSDRRENIGRVFILEFPDKFYQFADYCRERYLLEGGHTKEMSEQFRFSSRYELELIQVIEEMRKEQGAMDDYEAAAVAKRLKEKFDQPLETYQSVIDDYASKGVLETFHPEGSEPAYRINNKELFNKKLDKWQRLEEMMRIEKKIMA